MEEKTPKKGERLPCMVDRPDLLKVAEEGENQKKFRVDLDDVIMKILAVAQITDIGTKEKAKGIFALVNGVAVVAVRYKLLTDKDLWRKVLAVMNLPEWKVTEEISYFAYENGVPVPRVVSLRRISNDEFAALLFGEELYAQFLDYSARAITEATQAQRDQLDGIAEESSDHIIEEEEGGGEEVVIGETEAYMLKARANTVSGAVAKVIDMLAEKHEQMNRGELPSYNYLIIEMAAMEESELSKLIMPGMVTHTVQEINSREAKDYTFLSSLQLISEKKLDCCFMLAQNTNVFNYVITITRQDGTTLKSTSVVTIGSSKFPYPVIEGTKFVYDGHVYWRLRSETHGLFVVHNTKLEGGIAHYVYPLTTPVKVKQEEGETPLTETDTDYKTPPLLYDDVSVVDLDEKLRYCWYAHQSLLTKNEMIVCDLSKLPFLLTRLTSVDSPLVMDSNTFDQTVQRVVTLPNLLNDYKILHSVVLPKTNGDGKNHVGLFLYKPDNKERRHELTLRVLVYSKTWTLSRGAKIFKLGDYFSGKYSALINFQITFLHPEVFIVQCIDSTNNGTGIITRIIEDNLVTGVVKPTNYVLSEMPLSDQMKYLLDMMVANSHYMLYYNTHGTLFNALFHKISMKGELTRLTVFKQQIASTKASYGTKFIIEGTGLYENTPFTIPDIKGLAILDFLPDDAVDAGQKLLFGLRQKGNNRWFLAELLKEKSLTESDTYDLSRSVKMSCSACSTPTDLYDVEEEAFYCNEQCRSLNNSFSRLML